MAVAQSLPAGIPGGTGRASAPGSPGSARRAGQRGLAGRGALGAGTTSRPGLTLAAARLRSSWSRRATGSSSSQRPSRGPMAACAGRRGAEGGAGTLEPGSVAHRPGRGGSERRPERGGPSSPICWRCPLPSAVRGRRLKGEDPARRVRGGGSAQLAIAAAAASQNAGLRAAPVVCDRFLRPAIACAPRSQNRA